MGATTIIGIDSIPERFAMARTLGVDHIVDFKQGDPVKTIMALTDGPASMWPLRPWARRPHSRARCASTAGRDVV